MYYLIYETKNLLNGKLYRGCHSTENIDDGYLGSGVVFQKALRKHGKENFKRTILEIFDNVEEMIEAEKRYVNQEWVNRDDTYNLIKAT